MPLVPERPLSYGEILEKQRKLLRLADTSPGTRSVDTFEEPAGGQHGMVRLKASKWRPGNARQPQKRG